MFGTPTAPTPVCNFWLGVWARAAIFALWLNSLTGVRDVAGLR